MTWRVVVSRLVALVVVACSVVTADALRLTSGALHSLDELEVLLKDAQIAGNVRSSVLLDVGKWHLEHDDTAAVAELFLQRSAALGNPNAQFLLWRWDTAHYMATTPSDRAVSRYGTTRRWQTT
ncbi:hypothetical protein ATCC90586_006805 [Pythium insidiosum]|nr:hypothetical protein ATCC90586_006805 [Pythium insidiosum]